MKFTFGLLFVVLCISDTLYAKSNVRLNIADKILNNENLPVTITGKVTDEKGQPLVGVSILIKGTSNGAVTDIEGKFKLNVPNEKAVLLFRYIGYINKEVVVGNASVLNVMLIAEPKSINEIVVVGYSTQTHQCRGYCFRR
jgi:hypothetical protein